MGRWPITTELERFEQKILINNVTGCYEWQGCKNASGYGKFSIGNSKNILAHRKSYLLYKGPIPSGLQVCHHCDNPPCVNPEHLFLGTQKDNVHDAQKKGRLPTINHPSLSSYSDGCRCEDCKKIQSDYDKSKRIKNKEYISQRNKKKYYENKDKILSEKKLFYIKNREKLKQKAMDIYYKLKKDT